MMIAPRETGSGRGFTLVEVMMAAGILALGVLGLLALFAGTARQQQESSQTSTAVIFSRNAEAILRENISGLDSGGVTLDDRVWFAVPMTNRNDQFHLTVNPNNDPRGLFAVAESTEANAVLFDRPNNETSTPFTATGGSLPEVYQEHLGPLRHRRVLPQSLTIEVTFAQLSGQMVLLTRTRTYSRPAGSSWPVDPMDDEVTGSHAPTDAGNITAAGATFAPLYLDGDFANYGQNGSVGPDWIVVDLQESASGDAPAEIVAFSFTPPMMPTGGWVVDEIAIDGGYQWKNDNLVSLSDRVFARPDEDRVGARRPELGYSVLYRSMPGGAPAQMAVFTYTLTPPSSGAEWIPPERQSDIDNDDAPLREATVELAFDERRQQYYITPDRERDEWATAPGQVLLVSGRNAANPFGSPGAGADASVRVLQRVREDGELRSYLDRAPRFDFENFITGDISSGSQVLDVWGVQEQARSLEDRSIWRLDPVEVLIFQLGG